MKLVMVITIKMDAENHGSSESAKLFLNCSPILSDCL